MPRIFDNIDQSLLPALQETLGLSERADFCVGYFNLRGWKSTDEYVNRWSGGPGQCCRLLVGMQRLPQEDLSAALSVFRDGNDIDNQTAIRLKKKLAEDFRQQLMVRIPTNYKITGVGHWFTFTLQPPKFWRDGEEGNSTRENTADFKTKLSRDTTYCCLCSSLHYWIYQARTNCRDFNPSDLQYLPVPETVAAGLPECSLLASKIMDRLDETSDVGTGTYTVGGSVRYQKFTPKTTKPFLDEIAILLAKHYGLNGDELDFIINYDIKYRMGMEAGEDEGE